MTDGWFPSTEAFADGLRRAKAAKPQANISASLTPAVLTFYDAANKVPLAKVMRKNETMKVDR